MIVGEPQGSPNSPALGQRVPVVNVALQGEGHFLLELVDEVVLRDTGVVWKQRTAPL